VVTDILVKRDDRFQPDSRSIYHIQTTTIQNYHPSQTPCKTNYREGEEFNNNILKVLKIITDKRKFDAYESILLVKNRKKKLMNDEKQILGNIKAPFFKFMDNHTRACCNHFRASHNHTQTC
jgi:hypothetical protein